jgi:hypothetical protein
MVLVLRLVALSTLAVALDAVAAQEGVPPPPGLVPEQMWPAPTAADWQKPVQIRWQRTWEDAVRLSKQTTRPILVCVNMDGEIASEHYAGVRYRDPEIGKLYEPYVCVIASVYRHNPRDYDEQGRRIPCPRFGCVTCGEHMQMEPVVYEQVLDDKRIAPRHIMVELDGSETYDVFYTWDTQSVFDTIRNGIADRKQRIDLVTRGDRTVLEEVASPDSRDREEIEREFVQGDEARRRELLEAALAQGDQAPIELLRLASYALDPDLAKRARAGIAAARSTGAVDLIAETLRLRLLPGERLELVKALGDLGEANMRARTLANAHRGLHQENAAIDAARWNAALSAQTYEPAPIDDDPATVAMQRDQVLSARPEDADAHLDVAEASLLQALELSAGSGRGSARLTHRVRQLLFADVVREVTAAEQLGASGWRPDALKALVAFHEGKKREAYALATASSPSLPPDAPGRLAMELLALFAEARQEAIVDAVRRRKDWPPSWSADVNAAYEVLATHPFGRDEHAAYHYDFLRFFAAAETDDVLDRGLARFPASPILHQRHRMRLLERSGPAGLEADYERRLQEAGTPAAMPWFAGYASLVAAEVYRRSSAFDEALAAYGRAMERFERFGAANEESDAAHYLAMAHAGVARIHLEAARLAECLSSLQQSFATAPLAAAATDGLGVTAVQTADMLRARATEAEAKDIVAAVDAALGELPPAALEPPEYERASRGGRRPRGR